MVAWEPAGEAGRVRVFGSARRTAAATQALQCVGDAVAEEVGDKGRVEREEWRHAHDDLTQRDRVLLESGRRQALPCRRGHAANVAQCLAQPGQQSVAVDGEQRFQAAEQRLVTLGREAEQEQVRSDLAQSLQRVHQRLLQACDLSKQACQPTAATRDGGMVVRLQQRLTVVHRRSAELDLCLRSRSALHEKLVFLGELSPSLHSRRPVSTGQRLEQLTGLCSRTSQLKSPSRQILVTEFAEAGVGEAQAHEIDDFGRRHENAQRVGVEAQHVYADATLREGWSNLKL